MLKGLHDEGSLIIAFIGARGTGKTTQQKKITNAWLQNGGRVLVVPSSKWEPTFRRVPRIKLEQIKTFTGLAAYDCANDKEFAELISDCHDLLIVCDDIKGYLPESRMKPEVRQALISSRHRKVYMTFAVHGFTQVPPEFFMYIDCIYLFRCDDAPQRHRDKFRDLNAIIEAQERVRQKAQQNKYYFEIINNQQ